MKSNARKALIAILALAGFSAYAQETITIKKEPWGTMSTFPDPAERIQHRVNMLARELGLSSDQKQQATEILTKAESTQEASHDQMKAAHDSMHNAVLKNDIAAIDQAARAIADLMAQTLATHAKAQAAIYQILAPEQQAKYSEMRHGDVIVLEGAPGEGPFHGHFQR